MAEVIAGKPLNKDNREVKERSDFNLMKISAIHMTYS